MSKRVLLVEDDSDYQVKITKILSAQGYEVILATNGHEALSKARELAPQVILLDAILPKMGGFQVARLLKFDEKSKGIPIVMLTVLDRSVDRETGKGVGVDVYLSKPFTEDALLQAIQKLAP